MHSQSGSEHKYYHNSTPVNSTFENTVQARPECIVTVVFERKFKLADDGCQIDGVFFIDFTAYPGQCIGVRARRPAKHSADFTVDIVFD
jgi:hypothetical protein